MISDRISSTNNPKIKNILRLNKASERRVQQLFVTEGQKEIQMALKNGYSLHSIYTTNVQSLSFIQEYLIDRVAIYLITDRVANKISYSVEKEKVIALFHKKALDIKNLKISINPLVLVVEKVEKPGNIGAILRTANAAGVDAVLICDMQTDIYNPNVIRSSRGAIFAQPIALTSNKDAIEWLHHKNIRIYSTALTKNAQSIYNTDFTQPTAIVFGTEADGLSDFWLNQSNQHVIIPMNGQVDSLNVSVSVAIIIFEAIRQRNL